MAILFMDGFDHYATADINTKWTSNSSVSIGSVGRNSTSGLEVSTGGTGFVLGTLGTNTNDCIVGAAFKISSINRSQFEILSVGDSGTIQVSLVYDNGQLKAYRSTRSGTLLGTATGSISTGTYYYIELRTKIHNTTGTVDVYVNGSNVLSLTSQNTRSTSSNQWTGVYVGITESLGGFGASNTLHYDDVYISDSSGSAPGNAVLGPVRAKVILPDGAGNSSDFTPSAGSNYQNVDEASQDGDTTYNSESTPGDHDTYTFGAVGLTGTVLAVQTNLMVRSDGAGSETIRPKIRIGLTDYNGTTVGVTTSYADSREVFALSPATSAAWTVTEIDGAEFGIELVS